MKKKTLRKVIGLGLLVSLTTVSQASAITLTTTGVTKAGIAVQAALQGAHTIIVSGGVIAAAWGLYQVAFGDGSGKDWFLAIAGGALVGGYIPIASAIVGFFN